MLLFKEAVQALGAEFASETAHLPAAEWRLQIAGVVDVDANGARFNLLRHGPAAFEIAGVEIGGEAEGQGVGELQRLPVISDGANRGDRTELSSVMTSASVDASAMTAGLKKKPLSNGASFGASPPISKRPP